MAPAKLKQPEQQEMEVAAMQVNGEQLH